MKTNPSTGAWRSARNACRSRRWVVTLPPARRAMTVRAARPVTSGTFELKGRDRDSTGSTSKSGVTHLLRRLDEFLRRTWLECCGHMSAFEIGGQRYSGRVDREFDLGRAERSMAARVSSALTPGRRFS